MSEPVRRLSREEARRIAIRAQLLDADRPRELARVVDRLTFLQLDPTAAIAPSADLVAWSRLGERYAPTQLQEGAERDRTLFEHRMQPTVLEPRLAMVRPMADLGLFLGEMVAARSSRRQTASGHARPARPTSRSRKPTQMVAGRSSRRQTATGHVLPGRPHRRVRLADGDGRCRSPSRRK